MLKVMWINFKYLTNKVVLIVLGISIALIVLYLVINTNFIASHNMKIMYRYEYYNLYKNNGFNFIQTIFSFLSVFLAMMINKNYDIYIIKRINRKTAVLGRYCSVYFLILIMLFPIYSLFILIPNIFMPFFQIYGYFIINFLIIYLTSIILASMTLLVIEITNNAFSGFLIIVLFWMMKLIYGNVIGGYYHLFPLPLTKNNSDKMFFYNGTIWPIILFVIINGISVHYYCEKNIKK